MNYQHSTVSELVANDMSSPLFSGLANMPVVGMALNSRQIKPHWLFVAVQGEKEHGMEYIAAAQRAGAAAALVDERDLSRAPRISLPLIPVRNLIENMTKITDRLYGGEELEWSGVTGTNGKSSIVHLLAQGLNACGIKTATMGTVYQGFPHRPQSSETLTTPDPISLRRLRAAFYKMGARHLLVEASSHALAQNRLRDIMVTTGIMTNVTQDHQDYHRSFTDYVAAKRRLFSLPSLRCGIFNLDDDYGRRWFREFKSKLECLTYSLRDNSADVYVEDMTFTVRGVIARIRALGQICQLRAAISGSWQLANTLASLTFLLMKKLPLGDAINALSQAHGLSGRMQLIEAANGAYFFVDYAHTVDALARTLEHLRKFCQGDLWVVFGCGGDRDKEKRAMMGKAAAAAADRIILTNDNPRNEDPVGIIRSIKKGIGQDKDVRIKLDRGEALDLVMTEVGADDMVLVAGKGHETAQEIGDEKYPFSDIEYLRRGLKQC